ncbi:MAG: hypothetical protein IJX77_03750 [Ruminococcus sp.]|nr:hypothetical protein [Ruminococcus sp.]
MSYLGENEYLSFRENFCEPLPGLPFTAAYAADFGKNIPLCFRKLAVGCGNEKLRHILLALCSGIAESGRDVFICENTELPSFRYGFPITGADCGIYISGIREPRFCFFGRNGYPMSSELLRRIIDAKPHENSAACGKIIPVCSLGSIYVSNIRDSVCGDSLPISAGISCGNREIRRLWNEFFTDNDDTLIFQISDDCQRVNAYITELGFISYDRLILAYSIMLWREGHTVYLPESFHYAAEDTAKRLGYELIRFDPDKEIPAEAVNQRFLSDSLYMCVRLAENREKFFGLLKEVPAFTSSRREIPAVIPGNTVKEKVFHEPDGVVRVSRSGKNSLSLVVQSYETETAAELCSQWDEKLRKISSCTNLFQP